MYPLLWKEWVFYGSTHWELAYCGSERLVGLLRLMAALITLASYAMKGL